MQTFLNVHGSTPWAVIMVRFPDVLIDAADFAVDYFTRLFTNVPGSDGGMWQFWNEVSFRNITLDGTVVLGPILLNKPSTTYSENDNDVFYKDAMSAWWYSDPENRDFDPSELEGFDRIIFVPNAPSKLLTGGLWPLPATAKLRYPWSNGTRSDLAFVYLNPGDWNPLTAAHEMGHGYGLDHSFDDGAKTCGSKPPYNRPGEYCDRYDIMSAQNVVARTGPFGLRGPGLSAPYLLKMGWVAPSRIVLVSHGGVPSRQRFLLDPLENPDGTGTAVVALSLPNPPVGQNDIYTVEYREMLGGESGILVHRWDARDQSILLANAGRQLFSNGPPYVDVLDRFQVGFLGYSGGRAEIEIGPVGPSLDLIYDQRTLSEALIDEDSFQFPFSGAGREVENLCGSGDFHYRAYAQWHAIVCSFRTRWIDTTETLTVEWAINGVPLNVSLGAPGQPCVVRVLRTLSLPAPYGSPPRYADVTISASRETLEVLELRNLPDDGTYEFQLTVAVTTSAGEHISASADLKFDGQRLDVGGGWHEFIMACNIARLVWLYDIRNKPALPVPSWHEGGPQLPRNPGDPPLFPDPQRTIELLDWCALKAPDRLERAALGAVRLHGVQFAAELRNASWSQRLPWGRPKPELRQGAEKLE